MGSGQFAQIFSAYDEETKRNVAIKIIKDDPCYLQAAQQEIKILKFLNKIEQEKGFIVKLRDQFEHEGRQCMVFDLFEKNLLELIKESEYKGVKLPLVKAISQQILFALSLMSLKNVNVIHCDLKPENIML